MKLFTLQPNENWCVDRLVTEWNDGNSDISVRSPDLADTIWLCADWCFDRVPYAVLKSKKVVTTVHHITSPLLIDESKQINTNKKVEEKFFNNQNELNRFIVRHNLTSLYHTPCKHTKWQLEKVFNFLNLKPVPIIDIPFWVNDNLWTVSRDRKQELRAKYNLPQDGFLVGSFQRDSEGETFNPKLEKGADILVDVLKSIHKQNLYVVLTPWRRRFVMNKLDEAGISYSKHFPHNKQISFIEVNELYNCLDLYLVTSRVEGGPLAIPECAATKTPILAHKVGLAHDGLLNDQSILSSSVDYNVLVNNLSDEIVNDNYKRVSPLFISNGGFNKFRTELFDVGAK